MTDDPTRWTDQHLAAALVDALDPMPRRDDHDRITVNVLLQAAALDLLAGHTLPPRLRAELVDTARMGGNVRAVGWLRSARPLPDPAEARPCPTCRADTGDPCVTSGGNLADQPHAARRTPDPAP